jgi:hypothetical protein
VFYGRALSNTLFNMWGRSVGFEPRISARILEICVDFHLKSAPIVDDFWVLAGAIYAATASGTPISTLLGGLGGLPPKKIFLSVEIFWPNWGAIYAAKPRPLSKIRALLSLQCNQEPLYFTLLYFTLLYFTLLLLFCFFSSLGLWLSATAPKVSFASRAP